VLQRVAARCSVLQRVAACLLRVAACCSELQRVAAWLSALQQQMENSDGYATA